MLVYKLIRCITNLTVVEIGQSLPYSIFLLQNLFFNISQICKYLVGLKILLYFALKASDEEPVESGINWP